MNPTLTHALVYGAITAIAMTVLTALVDFDPSVITNWHVWVVGLGASAVRSGAQALLQAIISSRQP